MNAKFLAECQTGYIVAPSSVRLVTTEKDPYAWHFGDELSDLFSKHLSWHGVRACKRLCDNLGQTFRAVPSSVMNHIQLPATTRQDSAALAWSSGPSPFGDSLETAEVTGVDAPPVHDSENTFEIIERLESEISLAKDRCDILSQQLRAAQGKANLQEAYLVKFSTTMSQVARLVENF